MTVRELIASSLRLSGILAANESLEAGMADDALATLNDLLDSWRTERLTLTSQDRVTCAISGAATYTIGASGNFNRARPLWIDRAGVVTADGSETPIALLTPDQRAEVGQKSATADLPGGLFYRPTYPLGILEVYPIATLTSASLVLYVPAESLASVADVNTVLSLRPGWSKALRYGLAAELAVEYGVSFPELARGAAESKANIKRTNIVLNEQIVDRALRPYPGLWNYRRGDF